MIRNLALRSNLLLSQVLLKADKPPLKGFERFLKREKSNVAPPPSSKKPPPSSSSPPPKSGGGGGNEDSPNMNFMSPSSIGVVVAMAALYLLSANTSANAGGQEIDFQHFKTHVLASGRVEKLVVVNTQKCKVYLKPNTTSLSSEGKPKTTTTGNSPSYFFTLGSVHSFEKRLEEAERELGVSSDDFIPVQYVSETSYSSVAMSLLPTLLIVGASVWMMTRITGGGKNGAGGPMRDMFKIGKSPAKKMNKEESTVRFSDVAGCEEAKQEIEEFVEFLKNPDKFTELGAKIPKGAMLYGPPGTGKTLLAKAVAGEASVPFYSISGSDFLEMFVGVGPSRVRDLFATARKDAPCIIFIDEIDAVARARNKGGFGGNDERENTLNQLLVELDGFNTKAGVVVIAATNRLDILDPAILRPGRFDRQIKVDLPDIQGRKQMYLVHLRNIKILNNDANNVAQRMAALTPGFSGAQIANIVNEAAILAAREGGDGVSDSNFDKAVDRVIGGLEKKHHIMSPEEKKTVAYHEAGHAILGWFLEHADPLLKVTIIPRASGALGFAQYLPKELSLRTKSQLEDLICMALGGRASEELTFGEVTTGAQNDLQKVTAIAKQMVTEFGMSSKLGQVNYDRERNVYSEETAKTIDSEVKLIVDQAFQRAKDMLTLHREEMEKVAKRLLEFETITQHDIQELIGARQWKTPQSYSEFLDAGKTVAQKAKDVVDDVVTPPPVAPEPVG